MRALGLRAARDARDVAQVAAPVLSAASPAGMLRAALALQDGPSPLDAGERESLISASKVGPPAPTRCADLDELRGLLASEGLERRGEQMCSLVRRSVRLIEAEATADAPCAWVDLAAAATLFDDRAGATVTPTVILAQFRLSAPELADTTLGGGGWLTLFAERAAGDVLAVQVTMLDQPAGLSPSMRPMLMVPQLALPRVWHQAVQDLELTGDEHDAFVRFRDRLASRQGIDPDHAGGADRPYHRLLGYPDETTGAMPADCQSAAGPGDWRLLLQLTTKTADRIYVWTADDQLQRLVGFTR